MAIEIKEAIKLDNGLEIANPYISVRSFRYLSDLQMEVIVDFYVSYTDKQNGIKSAKESVFVLDIDKSKLATKFIYDAIYDELKTIYPTATDVKNDQKTSIVSLKNGLKNNILLGNSPDKGVIIIKEYKFDKGSQLETDGKGDFQLLLNESSVGKEFTISAKANGLKKSDDVTIKIIQTKNKDLTYTII